MSAFPYVLAMDSGGSKTVALLAQADGTVVAGARGRGAASTTEVPGAAQEALAPVIAEVLRGLPADGQLVAVYACLGGLNTASVSEALRHLCGSAAVEVARESTGDVVFTGAPHWGFDLAIMAGTGSIALGVNAAGERRVTGGWGPLVHDRGSGYDVGRLALQALAEAVDYRGGRTLLLAALGRRPPFADSLPQDGTLDQAPAELTYAQRLAIKEGIKRAYPRLERGVVASLFPTVAECARQGDALALGLLRQAAEALAAMIQGLAGELRLAQPRIVALGGVFGTREPMLGLFSAAVSRLCPGARVVGSDFSLIRGAVVVALRRAGLPVDDGVVARVRETAARFGA